MYSTYTSVEVCEHDGRHSSYIRLAYSQTVGVSNYCPIKPTGTWLIVHPVQEEDHLSLRSLVTDLVSPLLRHCFLQHLHEVFF